MLIGPWRSTAGRGAVMTCGEVEDLWNERLDDRSGGPSELERRLEAHAARCGPCRATSARYQALRQALATLGPPPSPSAEETGRLLAVLAAAPVSPALRPARIRPWLRLAGIPTATAAALAGLAWLGGIGTEAPPRAPGPIERPITPVAAARPLDSALAEATWASIELARQATGPAARIGREVLIDLEGRGDLASPARPLDLRPESAPSSLLGSVGDRVNAGVRPLSGSARHAFSFLLGPAPARRGPDGPATRDRL